MWSIRFLSGPKAGKKIILPPGLVVLGRESSCQIPVPANGISKKHVQITVGEKELVIEDLNSRNGTFIKGKQIHSQTLKSGDRVALYNVIFEVTRQDAPQEFPVHGMPYPSQDSSLLTQAHGDGFSQRSTGKKGSSFENIKTSVLSYMNNVILPGIYKLAEWIEFKFLVGCFVMGFIILVTVFSIFPLISILRANIEQESRYNAENIAMTVAEINKDVLKKGLQTAATVDFALRRPKVETAYIISAIDGRILAPANIAHTYPRSSLIHKARKLNKTTVEKMGVSSIAAIVPISFYNPETGESLPRFYSVVIYQIDSLITGAKKVGSLLVQNFLIAGIIGAFLFFCLISLIEFPIKSLNNQLGQALKEEKSSSITLNYQSQILTELCNHINSALNQISLNRIIHQKTTGEEEGDLNHRQNEMNNLVEVVGFPALSINIEQETVASLNSNFTDQIGLAEILHQPVADISNNSLKEHLQDLIEQGKNNPQEIAFGEIALNQMNLQSTCQFIMGKKSPAYAIITFMSPEAEEGAA